MPVSIFRWYLTARVSRAIAAFCNARPAAGLAIVGVKVVLEDAIEIADAERAEDEDARA